MDGRSLQERQVQATEQRHGGKKRNQKRTKERKGKEAKEGKGRRVGRGCKRSETKVCDLYMHPYRGRTEIEKFRWVFWKPVND